MYIKELKSRKMNLPPWSLVLSVIAAAMCYGLKLNIISSLVTNPEKSSCFEPIPDTRYHYSKYILRGSSMLTCMFSTNTEE